MEEKNNKKVILAIIGVIILIAGVVGLTIAYFKAKAESEELIITSKNLSISYEQDDSQTLLLTDMEPIYDSDIETEANKVGFGVKNTSSTTVYLTMNLIDIELDSELASLDFKWALYETDSSYSTIGTKVSNGNFRNILDNKQLLTNNIELEQNGTKYYRLYIWISESDVTQEEMIGKSLSTKIQIVGSDKKSSDLLATVIKEKNSPIVTEAPDINNVTTIDEGLIQGVDDDGETYYFRGNVEDNYVKINGLKWTNDDKAYFIVNEASNIAGGFTTLEEAQETCDDWYQADYEFDTAEECYNSIVESGHSAGEDMSFRIIRINGDNTIRLITDGSIGNSVFNDSSDNGKYVGYTYDNSEANIQDGTSSTMKTYLESWYNTNMSSYDKYIANTRFCNDTSMEVIINGNELYSVYYRIGEPGSEGNPTFKCQNTEETYGGEYDLKIGLINADEANFSGQAMVTSNYFNYLIKNISYPAWTMSPAYGDVNMILLNYAGIFYSSSKNEYKTMPVINLRSDTLYTSGDGTKTTPYVIG